MVRMPVKLNSAIQAETRQEKARRPIITPLPVFKQLLPHRANNRAQAHIKDRTFTDVHICEFLAAGSRA